MNAKQLIMTGIVFIFGVGAGWIAQGNHWDLLFTSYVPALVTLLAAFLGAKYAFDFQRAKEHDDANRKNVVNGNNAIFILHRMINILLNYRKQIIDPIRDKPGAFIRLAPTLGLPRDSVNLNIDALYFLLETEDLNILGEITVEENKFHSALDLINERSRLHQHEVQPQLERAGILEDSEISIDDIKKALGPRLYITLQNQTNEVINSVDDTIKSLKAIAEKLRKCMLRQFPQKSIIGFNFPE